MFADVMRGLRRNVTMTVAMVLTTAISLCLLGAGLVVARMTDQMKGLYGNKVEVSVFLTKNESQQDPNCTDEVCHALGDALNADKDIERATFQNQAAAWQQYQKIFAGQPAMLDIASADALPTSWKVKLKDPERYKVIQARYANYPGVDSVTDQSKTLDPLFNLLDGVRNATIIVALVQALAAFLLISNTVQMAAYTRRTETSIMRLVGASRWRTQMPFVLEAVVAAIMGTIVAIAGLVGMKYFFVDRTLGSIMNSGIMPSIDLPALIWVSPILAAIAIGLAGLSSYVTLRLYVRL